MRSDKLLVVVAFLTCISSGMVFAVQQGKENYITVPGKVQGTAIGVSICKITGYSYADTIAKHRQALQGKENDLNARISYAQAVNKDTEDYINRLAQQVELTRDKIENLQAKVRLNEISQSVLKQEKQCISQQLHEAKENQALAQKELASLKGFRSTHGQSGPLDAEINKFEKHLVQIKKNTAALAALNQRI